MPETKQIITIYYSFGGCMRKHIKEKIITLAATVEEAGHYIVDCMERGQAVQSESVLEDVRQSALRMAEIVADRQMKLASDLSWQVAHCCWPAESLSTIQRNLIPML